MKYVHILTPSKTHGGFHPLCRALLDEPFDGAKLTVGSTYAGSHVPDLVIISMGTDRAVNFGNSALTSLQKSKIPKFGIFTTIAGMRRFIDGGLPDLLGDRMLFAVIEGLKPEPTGWPKRTNVIRISNSNPPNGTDMCLVRSELLKHIGPEKQKVELVEHAREQRVAAL